MNVVVLQSLPQYCVVCKGDEQVAVFVGDNAYLIPCPHCSGSSALRTALMSPGATK